MFGIGSCSLLYRDLTLVEDAINSCKQTTRPLSSAANARGPVPGRAHPPLTGDPCAMLTALKHVADLDHMAAHWQAKSPRIARRRYPGCHMRASKLSNCLDIM